MRIIDKDGEWFTNVAAFPMQDYVSGLIFPPGESLQVKPTAGTARLLAQGVLTQPPKAVPAKPPVAPAEPPKQAPAAKA